MGEIQPKQFYLFGEPIKASRSPALHNTLFTQQGFPHHYGIVETSSAEDTKSTIRSPDFGGGSVTIPLKLDIMPFLDSIAEEAQIIGAVNTIVSIPSPTSSTPRLLGRNTDWLGIVHCFRQAGAYGGQGSQSSLVIGGGGTARAAIYALHSMKYTPIYLVGRQPAKLAKMVSTFPTAYDIRILETESEIQDLKTNNATPVVAIGTIPADKPIDSNLQTLLRSIFAASSSTANTNEQASSGTHILLEMAYKPRVTPLMEIAEENNWNTIPGLEALVGQGMYQVCSFFSSPFTFVVNNK